MMEQPPAKKALLSTSAFYPPCQVCGDRSSGLHYGVITCNGCRSFFRRAIGGKKDYVCEYGEDCVIDVKARAQCKACRLKKSLEVGMRPEEVVVCVPKSPKEPEPEEKPSNESLSLQKFPVLFSAAKSLLWNFSSIENTVGSRFAPCFPKFNLQPSTTVQETFDGVTTELHYLVEWVKQVDIFDRLDKQSKISLLRTHCTELIFLEVVRRTMSTPRPDDGQDFLVGANGFKIMRNAASLPEAAVRIFSEILDPCRHMKVTDEEFLCLKALVMFNPYTDGVSDKDMIKISLFQQQVRMILETLLTEDTGRMFGILMILPSLSNVGEQFRDHLRYRRVTTFAKSYKLMEELVLDENK